MKTNSSFILALGAVVAAAVANAQTEPDCPSTEVTKLVSLVKTTSMHNTCKAAVPGTFSLVAVTGEPTTEQWKTICTTAACTTTAAEVRNITTLSDCKIVNKALNKSYNVFRFGRDYDSLCAPYTPAPTPAPTTVVPTSAPQPDCPSAEVAKLSSLLKTTSMHNTCKAAVPGTFSLVAVTGEPTTEQWKTICTTAACTTTAAEVRNITTLSDCMLVNKALNKSYNVFRFGRDYDSLCAPYTSAPTPAPTTVVPTPVPSPTTTVSPTPEPVITVRPGC